MVWFGRDKKERGHQIGVAVDMIYNATVRPSGYVGALDALVETYRNAFGYNKKKGEYDAGRYTPDYDVATELRRHMSGVRREADNPSMPPKDTMFFAQTAMSKLSQLGATPQEIADSLKRHELKSLSPATDFLRSRGVVLAPESPGPASGPRVRVEVIQPNTRPATSAPNRVIDVTPPRRTFLHDALKRLGEDRRLLGSGSDEPEGDRGRKR